MKKTETIKHVKGYIAGFLVFAITLPALIYGFSRIEYPLFRVPIFKINLINTIISIPLFITGFILVIWSNIDLFRIGKGGPADVFNIEISPRSKNLVVTGPYRYTRNPMVFGANAIYFAIALFLNSLMCLIFVCIFQGIIILYLKLTEEKRLLNDFGEDYREYRKNVSMILPLPRRKKQVLS